MKKNFLLLLILAGLAQAQFMKTNGKIAFVSNRDGDLEIYVMNYDGSGVTQLTNNTASDESPAWSPDGSKIAFHTNRDGDSEIYVMNADGSNASNITNSSASGEFAPTWSPDGSTIAFATNRSNPGGNALDIYKVSADGTGPQTPLAATSSQEANPAWAPDNSKILYNHHTSAGDQELYTMNLDGTGQAFLPPSIQPLQRQIPNWSPNAQQVIYQGDYPGVGIQIYTSNANGTGGATALTSAPGNNTYPAFAPEGNYIVFTSDRDGNGEIYVMNADGSGHVRLTNNSAADFDPDWQAFPLKAYVLLANQVTLKRTKQATPGGDIHSNGALTVEKGDPSTYNSNLTAVGKITINKQNTINGNVKSQSSISNSGTINGTTTVEPVGVEPLPSLSFSAGGVNNTVPSGGVLALAPGSYGIVTMSNNGTLKLASGEYFMNELRYSGSIAGGVIEIDLTSGDPATINVVSNLQLGKEVEIRLLPNGESDSKLVSFFTLQSALVNVGKEAYFLGGLHAPNAKVTLVKNSQLRGAICANEILVERDCLFLPHDSPGSLPGPGNLPKILAAASDQLSALGFELAQNYPNPFNPSTTIRFSLPAASSITLKVYNLAGQEVATLLDEPREAGMHTVQWNASGLPSGVYFYRLQAGEFEETRKLLLMR